MSKPRTIAIALVILTVAGAAEAESCRVVDGDGLHCSQSGRVRLKDIYAAERHDDGGAEATARLRSRIEGRDVHIKPHGRDSYGRTLGDVSVGGRTIRQEDVGPRAGRGARR